MSESRVRLHVVAFESDGSRAVGRRAFVVLKMRERRCAVAVKYVRIGACGTRLDRFAVQLARRVVLASLKALVTLVFKRQRTGLFVLF